MAISKTKNKFNFLVFLRMALGLLFVVSGFNKLIEPYQNFMSIILTYDLVDTNTAALVAMVLPWAEFLLGLFLLIGLWLRPSLVGLWFLNMIFLGALASTFIRKISLGECGCFGGFHLTPQQTFVLDIVLFLCFLSCFLFKDKTREFSLDKQFQK